jgi:hypothetical protein
MSQFETIQLRADNAFQKLEDAKAQVEKFFSFPCSVERYRAAMPDLKGAMLKHLESIKTALHTNVMMHYGPGIENIIAELERIRVAFGGKAK